MPRVQLYDEPLPSAGIPQVYVDRGIVPFSYVPPSTVPPRREPEPIARPTPIDCIYASAVLSTTRLLATFYWGRSLGQFNKPLILLEFAVNPLDDFSWRRCKLKLDELNVSRRVRSPVPLGLWIEGEALAVQALYSGIEARPLPPHLSKNEAWHPICQSVAGLLAQGQLGYTAAAAEQMDARPFLDAAGVFAGPRTEDPTIAAFLFGAVLGLDEVLARDPHPKPPVKSRR